MSNSPLPTGWRTERTAVSDARPEDASALHDIFNACRTTADGDPTFYDADTADLNALITQTRQEQAGGKSYRAQVIRVDSDIVGYFLLTESEPLSDLIWLSLLALHPNHQDQRLGREIFDRLVTFYARDGHFRAIWLEVYVKNWRALSFWIRQGFTRIIEYGGKGDGGATLVLERSL